MSPPSSSQKSTLQEHLARFDSWIREGRGDFARRELHKLVSTKVPREHLLDIARVARRVHLSGLAIRLLNPIVRPTGKNLPQASEEERAEYAANLTFVGAAEEGQIILESCDPARNPQVHLFRAYSLFAQWDYAAAIPILRCYVEAPGLQDYQRLVGKVNLAAALVHERQSAQADSLLAELLEEAHAHSLSLLQGNLLELSAQSALYQRDWPRAELLLKKSGDLLESASGLDQFVVAKWKAVLRFLKNPKGEEALAGLRGMRDEARQSGHWESVRDAERFEAMGLKDPDLLRRVYFGTPFASYRARLLGDYASPLLLPADYVWELEGSGGPVFDLNNGDGPGVREPLMRGGLLHRLLVTLSLDFYRPARMASIHFQLYPDEFFNPVSSPARVHQAVKRLRQWIARSRMPLEIREQSGYYSLRANKPFGIRILRKRGAETDFRIETLRHHAGSRPFSAREAGQWLGLSSRSALRLLGEKEQEGLVRREGRARAVRYSFRR